jgi:hypothetical protein
MSAFPKIKITVQRNGQTEVIEGISDLHIEIKPSQAEGGDERALERLVKEFDIPFDEAKDADVERLITITIEESSDEESGYLFTVAYEESATLSDEEVAGGWSIPPAGDIEEMFARIFGQEIGVGEFQSYDHIG